MKSEINIIIHGFGGSTAEIAYLADFLRAKGANVHVVALAGHGGTKRRLAQTTHSDWIASARDQVAKLADIYDKINLMGFSMGGLISAHLAAEFGAEKIGKIVFINTPIYFWNVKIIAGDVMRRDTERIAYYANSASRVGAKSAVEFLRILSRSKRLLARADMPMPASLILQCMDDESVRHKSAGYIKDRLGAAATLKYYEGGRHLIFTQNTALRDIVCGDIYSFINR
ncbi:MAG: alpha/beta fold hydrolase [Clostridiales bacterium]|jgi:esterase/lipase|nr:alpha/beta fold hydrolase [Clostridiales bacterium]